KNRNDGDDHQQLNQRESTFAEFPPGQTCHGLEPPLANVPRIRRKDKSERRPLAQHAQENSRISWNSLPRNGHGSTFSASVGSTLGTKPNYRNGGPKSEKGRTDARMRRGGR